MVLGDFFKKHSQEIPNNEALVFKERRITFKQYDEATDRVAMGLLKLGVQRGDRIAIYGPLWPEVVFAYFGAAKIGAIGVPMSARTTAPELKFFVNDSESSVLFMPSTFMGGDFMANLDAVREEMPTLKHVVCFDLEKEGVLLWEKFLTDPDPAVLNKAKDAVQEDDSALFIYTSGTTGVPKAAQLTHKNLIALTNAQIEATGYHRGHIIVLNLPFSHVGGAVMGIICNVNVGNKVVMMDAFNPEETLRLVSEEKATTLGQVPAMYAMELSHPNLSKYDISTLKLPIVSSQPCPSELISAFKKIVGVIPLNAYGLTETTAAITYTHPSHGEEKLTYSVGKPVPSIQMVLKDDDGNIMPQGEAGEICVKGPVVMKGYWKRPEEDAKVFDADGFLHTGDMGRFEEDGSLVIVGRKKEMYIRGGENVYPPQIEDAICKHPDVMLAAVIGRPHEKWGEVGRAYIMPKPGKNPTPEEIKEFLKDKLSNFKIPEDVIIRPILPLTPLGKVKKLDLYTEMKQELGKK
ncbi:MAG: class I adenylate-forming enzyme family protein [Syntrophales bacterium]|nr:class I adenylate-forming enzyme family protein [Syntrophales bacterium]HOG08249.1 class I adenylate-forming enzyme family protein [Syntrophales bacterium]HOS76405.1 class I adenylate-forming enzyme family protein [Syntrophales bacterium]HPB70475.1 class I adenylate-forming enzyme family protein [Syntrophales bacterium]HQP28765.1 class I adenylate-forming enzyme family protein [Syntrophales bacterium]